MHCSVYLRVWDLGVQTYDARAHMLGPHSFRSPHRPHAACTAGAHNVQASLACLRAPCLLRSRLCLQGVAGHETGQSLQPAPCLCTSLTSAYVLECVSCGSAVSIALWPFWGKSLILSAMLWGIRMQPPGQAWQASIWYTMPFQSGQHPACTVQSLGATPSPRIRGLGVEIVVADMSCQQYC